MRGHTRDSEQKKSEGSGQLTTCTVSSYQGAGSLLHVQYLAVR